MNNQISAIDLENMVEFNSFHHAAVDGKLTASAASAAETLFNNLNDFLRLGCNVVRHDNPYLLYDQQHLQSIRYDIEYIRNMAQYNRRFELIYDTQTVLKQMDIFESLINVISHCDPYDHDQADELKTKIIETIQALK